MSTGHRLELAEFKQLCGLLSGANNTTAGISNVEVGHLCWLGAQAPAGGSVVEIGSHRGKSTCCLAAGVRHSGSGARVYACDLWMAGLGRTFDHYSSEETWRIFQDQVKRMKLGKIIHPVQGQSTKLARRRKKPIDVLFIDASHKYAGVHADFVAWSGFVRAGGLIAFHDYGTRFEGVDRVVNEELMGSGGWDWVATADRIFTARRKAD